MFIFAFVQQTIVDDNTRDGESFDFHYRLQLGYANDGELRIPLPPAIFEETENGPSSPLQIDPPRAFSIHVGYQVG